MSSRVDRSQHGLSASEVRNVQSHVGRALKQDADEARLAELTRTMVWKDEDDESDDEDLRKQQSASGSASHTANAPASPTPPIFVKPAKNYLQHSEKLFDGVASDGKSVLNKPSCVIALPSGDLCVADTAADRLLVVDPVNRSVRSELTGGAGAVLKQPRGLACDATSLYVSEVGGGALRKLRLPAELRPQGAETPRGAHLGGLQVEDAESAVEGQLTFPQGLAVAHGELFVTDCEDHRVAVYDALTLQYKRAFGTYGEDEGELSFPYSCAVVGEEVYVCDVANDRISVFDRVSGVFQRCLGGDGTLVSQPRGVAAMPLSRGGPLGRGATSVPSWSGHEATTALVVVEKSRVCLLSLSGALLQDVAVTGAVDMWSVCATPDGKVYVTDKGANAIHVLIALAPSSSAPGSPLPGSPLMPSRAAAGGANSPLCAAHMPRLCAATAAAAARTSPGGAASGSSSPLISAYTGADSPPPVLASGSGGKARASMLRFGGAGPSAAAAPKSSAVDGFVIDVGDSSVATSALIEGLLTGEHSTNDPFPGPSSGAEASPASGGSGSSKALSPSALYRRMRSRTSPEDAGKSDKGGVHIRV